MVDRINPGQVTDTMKSAAAGVQDKVPDQVQQQVTEKAQQAKSTTTQTLKTQLDTRTTAAGEQVTDIANMLRRSTSELRDQGKDAPARAAEMVAERVERLGGYLRDADADRMLQDVENVARRQPALVAGAGLTLGFLASRFLKVSSSDRYELSSGRPATPGYGPGTGYYQGLQANDNQAWLEERAADRSSGDDIPSQVR
jgi:hypothetical protein